MVDLTPLIIWWEEPHGIRPLLSWRHIRGTLEKEAPFAWVVRAKVDGEGGIQRFVLKNPPPDKLRRSRELQNMLHELETERTFTQEIANLPMYEGWEWDYYGMTRSPTKDFDRIDQAKGHLRELDHRIHLAKDELSYLVDEHGNLKIDAFALRTNEINQGMHVFNFGYSP